MVSMLRTLGKQIIYILHILKNQLLENISETCAAELSPCKMASCSLRYATNSSRNFLKLCFTHRREPELTLQWSPGQGLGGQFAEIDRTQAKLYTRKRVDELKNHTLALTESRCESNLLTFLTAAEGLRWENQSFKQLFKKCKEIALFFARHVMTHLHTLLGDSIL